jgi:hypothetical protein
MKKFIRIFLLVFFITVASAWPLLAAKGGNGNGNNGNGNGNGGGGGVPEIDQSLAPSAVALLAGGLLILKSRFGNRANKD